MMSFKKKKSKVVEVQEDGTEIHGFESPEEKVKPKKDLPKDDIQQHSKFDKFKGEQK